MGAFDGRVALVTGGARGIGAAITRHLTSLGACVGVGYHNANEPAEKLQAELAADGSSVSLHQGSVGSPEDCQRVVTEALDTWGHIDFLVNNAGVTLDKTVRKMTFDDWHAVLDVNLTGPFYMTKAVIEPMIAQGSGRIVNISSVIAATGSIGQANYAASKSGLIGFSRSLARELAPRGITVNCVAPGYIDTDMFADVPSNLIQGIIERIPIKRLGTPEEVACAVAFLFDDNSSYITGTVIDINGGLEMV